MDAQGLSRGRPAPLRPMRRVDLMCSREQVTVQPPHIVSGRGSPSPCAGDRPDRPPGARRRTAGGADTLTGTVPGVSESPRPVDRLRRGVPDLAHDQFAPINANNGHPAITRPYTASATATFAARLAALPVASSTHGSTPASAAAAGVGQQRHRRGDNHPIDDTGTSAAVHHDSPCADVKVCMCPYDTTAAMAASSTTLAVVVHRIHRSARLRPPAAPADPRLAADSRIVVIDSEAGISQHRQVTGERTVQHRCRSREIRCGAPAVLANWLVRPRCARASRKPSAAGGRIWYRIAWTTGRNGIL